MGVVLLLIFFPSLFGSFRRNGIWVIGDGCFTYIVFLLHLNGSNVRQKIWRRFIAAVKLPLLTLLMKSIVTCFCVQCLTEGA